MTDHDHAAGAGRRLTAEEEQRGAEMFAAGAKTRAVAAELGCGNGTASRLRQRLAARGDLPAAEASDREEISAPGQQHEAELAALRAEAGELAGLVETYEARAAASLAAVDQLERERLEVLGAGRDALPLRSRRRDAEDDARDSGDAAGLARQRLDGVAAKIADLEMRQHLADLSGELAAAAAERDAVLSMTGERQRAAVVAAWEAPQSFVAAVADAQAAIARVEELAAAVTALAERIGERAPVVSQPHPTALWIAPDAAVTGRPLALWRAISEAREGNVAAVARLLGETCGWLPPTPAEQEAADAELRERAEAMIAAQPSAEAPTPWPHADPAAVGLDAQGHVLPPRHPRDFYYNAGAVWGNQG